MHSDSIVEFVAANRSAVFSFAWMVLVLIAVVTVVLTALVQRGRTRRAYEESRREIAAYVAEGTITVEAAEALLSKSSRSCSRSRSSASRKSDEASVKMASAPQ